MPRVMDIVTPLGPEVLLFRSMRAQEALGRLFDYSVTVLSTRNDIDPYQLLGKSSTVKLELPGGGTRHFDGIVTRFALAGSQGRFVRYEMVLRPWLWFLTRTADCRIFQEKTVEEIIREVFDPGKYPDAAFEFQLSNSYRTWEYCVQYRETDFNFVSRLMEQEGMYYYFQHVEGRHTMYIVDSPGAHGPYETYSTIPFVADVRSGTTERERISDWYYSCEVQPGAYVIDDYDFKKPYDELLRQTVEVREHEHALHEIFDYPGEYEKPSDGEQYVRARLEELQAQHERIQAQTNARGLNVGYTFGLQLHPRSDQNKQYLVTSARINFASQEHEATGSGGATYSCSFECTSANTQFRTPRETPKPVVQGIQTARVVGPEGQEIHTDQYGRVKVHFHWDRFGPQNERSTCWIRVSQGWAGKTYGMMNVPRIGHEVVVDFIEGDPDQPLITGRVYNADQKVPYELPKYAAYETWRTRSTPGGGVRDFNELRFDDRKDKEQVFIHAQRRMDIRVKRNKYETVLGSSNTSIGGGYVLTVGGSNDWKIGDDLFHKTDGKYDCGIGANLTLGIDGDLAEIVRGKIEMNCREITIEALTSITLKVGANFIKVDPSGVTVQGTLVRVNSGGGAAGTGNPVIEDPLQAATADTGEPGYLDNLPRGRGGGGRNRRTLNSQHALPFSSTRLPNGDVRLGNGLVVRSDPTDPTFQDRALRDLTTIASTERGSETLNSIDQSGHTVTIAPQDADHPSNVTTFNARNASSRGPTYRRDGDGNRVDYEGTGEGSDSTIYWQPDDGRTMANGEERPSDVSLHHELSHADHAANGTMSLEDPVPPDDAIADNQDEVDTIRQDNEYRTERGLPTRPNHATL